jgi:hypothetical protein
MAELESRSEGRCEGRVAYRKNFGIKLKQRAYRTYGDCERAGEGTSKWKEKRERGGKIRENLVRWI